MGTAEHFLRIYTITPVAPKSGGCPRMITIFKQKPLLGLDGLLRTTILAEIVAKDCYADRNTRYWLQIFFAATKNVAHFNGSSTHGAYEFRKHTKERLTLFST